MTESICILIVIILTSFAWYEIIKFMIGILDDVNKITSDCAHGNSDYMFGTTLVPMSYGFKWDCPECKRTNYFDQKKEIVCCQYCWEEFYVVEERTI